MLSPNLIDWKKILYYEEFYGAVTSILTCIMFPLNSLFDMSKPIADFHASVLSIPTMILPMRSVNDLTGVKF